MPTPPNVWFETLTSSSDCLYKFSELEVLRQFVFVAHGEIAVPSTSDLASLLVVVACGEPGEVKSESEMAAAKLSIPICIYVTSPRQLSFRLIGALRRYVNVGLNTLD